MHWLVSSVFDIAMLSHAVPASYISSGSCRNFKRHSADSSSNGTQEGTASKQTGIS